MASSSSVVVAQCALLGILLFVADVPHTATAFFTNPAIKSQSKYSFTHTTATFSRSNTHSTSSTKTTSTESSNHSYQHTQLFSSTKSSSYPIDYSPELTPGIKTINTLNNDFEKLLSHVRDHPYFRLYSVDMLGSCEYMPQELFECYSETCEIYPVDEDEIPPEIQQIDMDEHDFELDGWARWDMPSEDYYDIAQFPEEFTGYDGSEIWRFIHDRIAFHDDECLIGVSSGEEDEYDGDCWKADFNKAVSGMHSMISAQVVKGIQDKIESGELDESDGFEEDDDDMDGDLDVFMMDNDDDDSSPNKDNKWVDPSIEFKRRLSPKGETPQALENLYFGYMLLLSAAQVARDRLLQDCDSGKIDAQAALALKPVLNSPLLSKTDDTIQIASKKLHDHAVKDQKSQSLLWEARLRTRDLFRVMNCVQCNKCRLHGKISAMGLSTAFQLLLGRSGEGGDVKRVHRVELAALMMSLSKFSTAVKFCEEMLAKEGEGNDDGDDEDSGDD